MLPPLVDRFVAGETPAEAVDRARRLNDRGAGALLNLLGEHYTERPPVDADWAAYRRLLGDLEGLDAGISVKPTQVGLSVSRGAFRENAERIVAAAGPGQTVWFDMEAPRTVATTLDVHEALAREYPGRTGVCIQANLKRSREDVERLADVPAAVRLVKGAYDPPPGAGYRVRERVDAAYEGLLGTMFREFDGGIAVGSHDGRMIEHAIDLHERHGTEFEIQMLMGVRERFQFDLAGEYDLRQYVPYGPAWLAYVWRRIRERRENARFALRALLGWTGYAY